MSKFAPRKQFNLGDERLTQHTLNPLAGGAVGSHDLSVVEEDGYDDDYEVDRDSDGANYQEEETESPAAEMHAYDDYGELSPLMLSYLDCRVVALVREEMERERSQRLLAEDDV